MQTYNYYVGSLTNTPYSNSTFLNDHWTADIYEFSVDNSRSINLNLHNISEGDDADLSLYSDSDNNGLFDPSIDTYLIGSSNGGNSDDTINDYSVEAGTYFAQVESYDLGVDNHLNYTFDLSQNIVVDTLVDEDDNDLSPGDLSLREAIANISSGGTIDFDSSLAGGTITLAEGQLNINTALTINGLGADNLTISGNNTSRVFNISDGDENNLINVEINGLTISDGRATISNSNGAGGGISNRENLTIGNSTISNNESTGFGAGIANIGELKLFETTVSDNKISNFPNSGGFFTSGGGITNFSDASLEIDSSTISGNQANRGGGIFNGGSLDIVNTTISGNEAVEAGGGIRNLNSGTVEISFSTVTNNEANLPQDRGDRGSGGGISSTSDTPIFVNNTIIAGNQGDLLDVEGSFTSNGNNLIGDLQGSTGFNASEDLTVPVDSVIDTTLVDNGGFTLTHALVAGSPAIDAGDPNFPSPPEFDQRGEDFLRVFDGDDDGTATVDIGAVELIPDDNYEPNNTLETAYDITGLEQTQLEDIDGLGVANHDDWYKIETGSGYENLMINLQFTHANGDIDLILYNSSGDEIARGDSTTDNEQINVPAPAGIYYLEVYPYSGFDVGNTYDLWWDDVATL